jgi:hypothetical protein
MAGPAILQAREAGHRARRRPLSLGRMLRSLLNDYACGRILAAIDGIPDHDLERGGTSREVLRRDVLAYFRELQVDAERC